MTKKFVKITMSESGRQRLFKLLLLTDMGFITTFLFFVVAGHRFLSFFVYPVGLIKDFDAEFLARFILWVGVLAALVHFVDVWILWLNTHLGNRKTGVLLLNFFFITKIILFILTISIWSIMFYHSYKITTGLRLGFRQVMEDYRRFPFTKENIDRMQQSFMCCGDMEHKDWFHTQWIPDEFLPPNSPKTSKSVPFSCCDPYSLRPCVSDNIEKSQPGYDPKKPTIFTRGCREVVMQEITTFLNTYFKIPVYTALVLYIVHLLCLRYLQTSIKSALKYGHPAFQGDGYLFSYERGDAETEDLGSIEEYKRKEKQKRLDDKTPLLHRIKKAENDELYKKRKFEAQSISTSDQ